MLCNLHLDFIAVTAKNAIKCHFMQTMIVAEHYQLCRTEVDTLGTCYPLQMTVKRLICKHNAGPVRRQSSQFLLFVQQAQYKQQRFT